MDDNSKADIESQIQDVYTNPENPHHAGYLKGEQAAKDHMASLFKAAYGGPDEQQLTPPSVPASANNSSPPAAAGELPADTTPDDCQVCEQHLKAMWRADYEKNQAAAFRTRDFIFDQTDKADLVIFDRVMDSPLGNSATLVELWAKKADQIPAGNIPAVDISDVPYQKRIEMADAVAAFFLGGPAQGRLADNQLLRQVREAVGDDQLLINHAAKLHRKIFGK